MRVRISRKIKRLAGRLIAVLFLRVKFVVYNKVCTGIYVSSVAVDVDRYR